MTIWQKDPKTGLEWGPESKERMTWDEAEAWCKELGGKQAKPWELCYLFHEGLEEIKVTMKGKIFWSSYDGGHTGCAWFMNFNYGLVDYVSKDSYNYARCVRP